MRKNAAQTSCGLRQSISVVLGVIVAPAATPALIWVTLTTNFPLALIIMQLLIVALVSHWLSHSIIRLGSEESPRNLRSDIDGPVRH